MLKNTVERLILEESWNLMTTMEHLHRYYAVEPFVSGKTVLDAACGTGYGTYHLSKTAKQVYGIDISEDAVEYAEKHFQNENLKYNVMSVAQIDFEDESFDVITSFETIEHITKDMQHAFLRQVKKKLKKDGILIMSTPNDQLLRDLSFGSYVNEFHLCEFTEDEYIVFLKQYFKYLRIYYQTVTQASAIVPREMAAGKGNVYSMEKDNHMGRYYVAVCSDSPVEGLSSLESTFLPVLEEYFDEAYFTKSCMLFVDRGNGFNDENKIISKYVTRDGIQFKCRFFLDDQTNIRALRFDPCEHGGKIRITKAFTNHGEITFVPQNASGREDGFDVFHTLDPQYIFQNGSDLKSADYITICGEIRAIPDHKIITEYEEDRQELSRQRQLSSDFTAQSEKLNDIIADQKNENNRLNVQNIELSKKITTLEENLSTSIKNLNILLEKYGRLEEKLSLCEANFNESQSVISVMKEKSDLLEQTLRRQNEQIIVLTQQGGALQDVLNEVYNSKSWKITAPFRRFNAAIKKEKDN